MTLPLRPPYAFLSGGGPIADLIAAFDWSATSLGPIEHWNAPLKTTIAFMLRSAVPMVALWGEDGVMIYNEGYSRFAGARHPAALGSKVRESWPEVATLNDHVIRAVGIGGETIGYVEQELTLLRSGRPEQVWLNLDYSPVLDEAGRPLAVVAIVIDVTAKVAADRWRDSERDRLRQMFEQAPGFIVMLRGQDHVIELLNTAYLQLVGHRDVLGKSIRAALPDIAGQGFYELLDAVYADGEAFIGNGVEVQFQHAPGGPLSTRIVDFVFQPVRDVAGRIDGIFVQGVDVTEGLLAGRAAQASRAQFETFAEAVPNHIWAADPAGHLDWFNGKVFEYSGLAAADLVGVGWTTIIHPDDLDDVARRWGESLTTGAIYEAEFRIRRADGAYRWHLVRALPIRDGGGEIVRWIGTNTDIHARKLAETEAARDRERIWTVSPNLALVLRDDGTIVDANPCWTETLGWSPDETIGREVATFLVESERADVSDRLTELARGAERQVRERLFRTRDGAPRRIFWTTVADRGLLFSFGRDITAEHAGAAALARAEEALRQSQKMEAVGQLTGGIAHDFNNLLQGITGSLEIVQRRVAAGRTNDLDRFIGGATAAAGRAAALTHRLLAFSRRQPLDPRAVRVNPLLVSIEDLLRRTLGEQVALELVLSPGLWRTLCDPNQLENAILNLAINARDAMPGGGRLVIETGNADLDGAEAARLGDIAPGRYICIAVTDTGIGMAADVIARAFEPFFTTKPIGQGTGLGLSMIYGFARQSEGHARIESAPGRGTTCSLYLPRHLGPEAAEEAPAEPAAAPVAPSGETVLVVEDEPVVRELIVALLGDLGYHVAEAADGRAGIAILEAGGPIDLLITDIGLPGLNGRQVADAGRAARPGLKILFMTGYAENAALAAGFLGPGMAMITKPFTTDALAARIGETIGRQSLIG